MSKDDLASKNSGTILNPVLCEIVRKMCFCDKMILDNPTQISRLAGIIPQDNLRLGPRFANQFRRPELLNAAVCLRIFIYKGPKMKSLAQCVERIKRNLTVQL